jgi:hypothetical protein
VSYIGAQPTTGSFPFDQFSGDGSTTAFTLTYAPASTTSIIVAISGVVQNPNLYSVIGTTITFSPAPPSGTNNISVLYLGLPVIGVSSPGNTAYFSSTSFTATGGQTTFAPSGSYQVGFINVIRNGSQLAPADYTATDGTTVVLNNACTAGDVVVIEVYTLTSISDALPLTGGTVTGATTFNAGVNLATSSGNVGIKTTNPQGLLHVVGGSTVASGIFASSGADTTNLGSTPPLLNVLYGSSLRSWAPGSDTEFLLERSGSVALTLAATVGGVCTINFGDADDEDIGEIAYAHSDDSMRFRVNAAERARIDSSGRLLIGTTSATVNPGVSIEPSGRINIGRSNDDAVAEFYRSGTRVGQINVTTTATSYITSSDYRLKEEIQPMTGALAKVAALKPCTYKWKLNGESGQGFIAHELAEVVPDAVIGEKDAVNEDGSIKPQGIDTSFLVATLTAAIQEQQAMIEELKTKVAALEAQ